MFLHSVLLLLLFGRVLATAEPPRNVRRSALQHDVDQYLAAHNVVREAYYVPPLQWSDGLADLAQNWADECEFKHSNGTLSKVPYGENMVAATGTFPILTALKLFSSDAAEYNPKKPTYNHFTQVVWKSTKLLGCAVSKCHGILDARRGLATVYVCLYQPPGNVIGEAKENVPV